MAADFDHVLTHAEQRRLDAALQKLSGAASRGAPSALAPSEYEEHVWLAQQQVPEAVLKHVVACRLIGEPDLARLVGAIRDLVRAWPDLNARFRFSEDGELHKRFAGDEGRVVSLIRADTLEQAIAAILDRQAVSWDTDGAPPFEVLVISCPQETVLALILHRILDAAHPAAELLLALGRAYAGEPVVPATSAAVRRAPGTPLLAAGEASAMLPAWMRRSGNVAGLDIVDLGNLRAPRSERALAGRYGTTIRLEALNGLAPDASDQEVLAHLAALFARYLSALSGKREIDLLIPSGPTAQLGDPPSSVAGGDAVFLIVDGQAPAEAIVPVIRDVLARTSKASMSPCRAGRAERPILFVNWLSDLADSLRMPGVSVERLPLPTLETRPDLAFAVGRSKQGNVAVELVTGQGLSPLIGPVLLERFLAWLKEGEVALPGASSAIAVDKPHRGGEVAAEEPATDAVAALILAEFRAALDAPELGPDDDFFDHGGHSLIATRIIGRLLSQHGIGLHFNDLFSYPSAAALALKARRTGEVAPETSRAAPIEEAPSAPLSLAQASLWKAYAAFGFNEIFNLPFALDFLEPVDEALYGRAFTDILERHPGLRSLFRQEGEGMVQQVVPAAELSQYKWFWTSAESVGVDRRDEAQHHFDLAKELPFRLRFLIDPATGRQVLSFLFHHVVLDEWSVNLMMDEIAYCYRVRAAGGMPVWSDAPAPFHEFARLQDAAGVDQTHLGYWTDMLRGAPQPQPILLRQDRAEPAGEEASAAGGWVEFKLGREATEGLYALAKQSSASLFNVVYAGIAASLRQLGSLPELVVGTSASGRSDAAFFDTVGYFTTVVAHRIRFDETMSLGGLVGQVRNLVNESLPSSEIPIDLVEEALGMTPGRDHLFEVFIQIHAKNKLNGELALPDGRSIAFRQVDPERHESMLGLHFEVMEEVDLSGERSIRVLMSYRSEHYGPQEVEKITATTSAVFALMGRAGGAQVKLAELGTHLPHG
ncbi:Phosphopantetheine attachment site [Bosea sp. 62]|uniref:condensation domain-containing protein n=1 Tax=unclassified Bosea (in: a-proteobacteria) TaxID=2653178 RepID=UPI0012537D82|nr:MULTISPECIES: condensation domain-containing protein [unclassified Bosea (in: a-proteobacteria)]CAD5296138.1 Phosphopantetheine attachment site [Bosea sp. 21B]CAD5296535.1 Phosphopantetheine attachment site [Bosea sp. 46]CAD5297558.1 Phosphopantetheine attachment site [Bosea sp. 7B]VVT61101.1 Phosphopantetheine attachment site [Bosea sp. EC-HK365B]VXB14697.1 Phosphopantetheine attachment site [Bosea sp. 125]